ncbi:hypothetical protein BDV96DRAFT_573789, partial [Lophiotrema nucula]
MSQLTTNEESCQLFLVSSGDYGRWNYISLRPRSEVDRDNLKKSIPTEKRLATWVAYENHEAVYRNAIESFPLLVAAVILGTIAGKHG